MGFRTRSSIKTLIITAVVFCTLAGCHGKQSQEGKKIAHFNLAEEPATLDPRLVRSLRDLSVTKQLFEGLMRLDAQAVPQMALAEQIEISEDKKTYTFILKETFYNDGTPLTSHDFAASWRKVLSPDFGCDYAHMLFAIKNAKKAKKGEVALNEIAIFTPDNRTLIVELEHVTPYFLELLCFPTTFAVPDVMNQNFDKQKSSHFVSNGPFQLQKWKTGNSLEMCKNENYWDKNHVYLDGLSFSFIKAIETENYLFEKGELDWQGSPLSQSLNSELVELYKSQKRLYSYDVLGTLWFAFNVKKSPLDNVNLRKAICLAFDRRALIDYVLMGNQTVATSLLPSELDEQPIAYFRDADFQEAKKLMPSLPHPQPPLSLLVSSRERNIKIAQLAQQQWKETLGIEVQIEVVETGCYQQRLKAGDYQIAIGEWIADFQDPIAFLENFRQTSLFNTTNWQSESYDTLLDAALDQKDRAKRRHLLQQAEKILMDEMVIAPLYHFAFDYIKNPELEGVLLAPIGVADFKSARLRSFVTEH